MGGGSAGRPNIPDCPESTSPQKESADASQHTRFWPRMSGIVRTKRKNRSPRIEGEFQLAVFAEAASKPAFALLRSRRPLLDLLGCWLSHDRHRTFLRNWGRCTAIVVGLASTRTIAVYPPLSTSGLIAYCECRGLVRRTRAETNTVVVGRLLWLGMRLNTID